MSIRNGVLQVRTGPRPGFLFLGIFVFPVLAWLGYNYFDRPLVPGAQTLLDAPTPVVPDAENLFLAMLALPVAGDESPHERGAAALAAYEAARARGPAPKTYGEALNRPMASFDEGAVRLCSAGNQEGAYRCLRDSVAQRAAIEQLLAQYWPLAQRYEVLGQYPRYSDPTVPTAEAPVANATAFLLSRLELSALALAAADGASDAAAASLASSATIWRRMIGAQDIALIDKLMATRALTAHTLLASEFLRSLPLSAPGISALEALLTPLTEPERSLAGPLGKEFRMQAASWSTLLDAEGEAARKDFAEAPAWWFRILAKRNASINLNYADLERVLAVERRGCVAVNAAVDAALRRPAPGPGDLPWHAYVYNPMGRILHTTMGGAELHLQYLGRQCNLLALQGMVGLQLELRRAGLSADATAAAVESSHFRDSNTGKAYAYDAVARTLSFTYVGKQKEFLSPLPLAGP